MPGVVFSVANHVTLLVLRLSITVEQRVGPEDAEDELILTAKSDAATFGQRQSSHAWDCCGFILSSRLWIGWTTDLESLGSNKEVCRVHSL